MKERIVPPHDDMELDESDLGELEVIPSAKVTRRKKTSAFSSGLFLACFVPFELVKGLFKYLVIKTGGREGVCQLITL